MEIILGILAVVNPILVAWGTIAWQNRKEKRDAKMRLFTSLMANRKSFPISREWVNSLNLITVVFADHREVVSRWHELYDLFQNLHASPEQRVHKQLDLLSEMSLVLGYRRLQQTDIDKYYVPEAHGKEAEMTFAVQQELLRVLQNSNRITVEPKHDEKPLQALPQPTGILGQTLPIAEGQKQQGAN